MKLFLFADTLVGGIKKLDIAAARIKVVVSITPSMAWIMGCVLECGTENPLSFFIMERNSLEKRGASSAMGVDLRHEDSRSSAACRSLLLRRGAGVEVEGEAEDAAASAMALREW